jgi:hypothetical protein
VAQREGDGLLAWSTRIHDLCYQELGALLESLKQRDAYGDPPVRLAAQRAHFRARLRQLQRIHRMEDHYAAGLRDEGD